MPTPRRRGDTVDDLLGAFTERLETATRQPSIYRWKPLPKQEVFHQEQARHRLLFGGNRSGKTAAGCADDVMILLRRHPYRNHMYPPPGVPLRMRFIGVDFERGIDQTAIPYFSQLIPPSYLVNGAWSDSYDASKHMLTLEDKSTVSFMAYTQRPNQFQSVSLHHIHFDEEPPKPIFDESLLRLIDTRGSWTMTETPVQQLEWVEEELIFPSESGARKDIRVIRMSTLENEHLSNEEVQGLISGMTDEQVQIRIAGEYTNSTLVFPEFKQREPFVIPASSFRLDPDEHIIYEGMDHGLTNPTAWVWMAVDRKGQITTIHEEGAPKVVAAVWAERVHQVRRQLAERYGISHDRFLSMIRGTFGDPAIADSVSDGTVMTTIQQTYAQRGIFISTLGLRSARAKNQNIGLDKMHTYMKTRDVAGVQRPWWQILDTCAHLSNELRKARIPKQTLTGAEEKNASEQIRDKDNHWIDATKYVLIATHDLRPSLGVDERAERQHEAFRDAAAYLHPSSPAPVSASDVYTAPEAGSYSGYRSLED